MLVSPKGVRFVVWEMECANCCDCEFLPEPRSLPHRSDARVHIDVGVFPLSVYIKAQRGMIQFLHELFNQSTNRNFLIKTPGVSDVHTTIVFPIRSNGHPGGGDSQIYSINEHRILEKYACAFVPSAGFSPHHSLNVYSS